MASRQGHLAHELRLLVLPLVRPVVRHGPEVVIGIAVLLSVLGLLVLVGAARDDVAIEAHLGQATAQVLDGSTWVRTLVRFTTPDGQVHTPELGVAYPRGLRAGELVRVQYDTTKPDLVRVAGRSWVVGLGPVLGGIAVLWALALPLAGWLRARRRRNTG